MIVTSDPVTHNITVTSLGTVGKVDSHLDVVEHAQISIASTVGYAYTYQTNITGVSTTVTDNIVSSETVEFKVEFNTTGMASTSFVGYSSLTEAKVLSWVSSDTLTTKQTANKAAVLLVKDKIVNPLKYQRNNSSAPPWS